MTLHHEQRGANLALSRNETGALPVDPTAESRDKLEADLAKTKDAYKEAILIVKDTLDVAWKLAPLAFLPASLFLWVYLRLIHWTAIFQDSAMTGSGLIFLFVAAMLLAFGVVLQFIAPSLFMIGTVSYYGNDRTIPKVVPKLYWQTIGGWIVGLVLVTALDPSWTWIVIVTTFAVAARYALIHQEALKLEVRPGACRHASTFHALFLAGAATVTTASTSMPLLLTLHVAQQYVAGGIFELVLGILICTVISIVSLVPGFIYLNARTWNTGAYRPAKLALLGAFFLTYIILAGAAYSVSISSTVLRVAGIFSNEPQAYEVAEPSVENVLSVAGLPVHTKNGVTWVTAYLRYGFGRTRLLCRSPLSEAALSGSAVKEALKKGQPDPGILAGAGCVAVSTSEVRLFRL